MGNEISEDAVRKVQGSSLVPNIGEEESPTVDSAASSIEKSKAVKPEIVPPMDNPILINPAEQESMAFAVASLDTSGRPVTDVIYSFILKGEEIKDAVLEGWMKNLRQIEEHVRQLLASPVYQQLQEIRRKGDPKSDPVSGIQGAASANAAAQKGEEVELLSTLDRLQVLERVPSSAEVPDTSPPQDSSRVLVLPLTAALLAGGFAIGMPMAHGASPVGGVMELVEHLKPLFPTVAVQDLVPLINLMVVGPLYFNSWNEAINNLKNREHRSYVKTVHNFAKDVIKIVTDPNFINVTLMKCIKGADQLSPEDQVRLAHMLKVVLVGVALSLLYSVEVGKVQDGKFGGMEPQELKSLLMNEFNQIPDPSTKATPQEQLTTSLIHRAWEQLKPLAVEDRAAAVEMLMNYVNKRREFDPMLDPAKVFDEVMVANSFNPKGKSGMVKA